MRRRQVARMAKVYNLYSQIAFKFQFHRPTPQVGVPFLEDCKDHPKDWYQSKQVDGGAEAIKT